MRTRPQKLEVFVFLRKANQNKILAESKAISNINALTFSPTLTKTRKKHAAYISSLDYRKDNN